MVSINVLVNVMKASDTFVVVFALVGRNVMPSSRAKSWTPWEKRGGHEYLSPSNDRIPINNVLTDLRFRFGHRLGKIAFVANEKFACGNGDPLGKLVVPIPYVAKRCSV